MDNEFIPEVFILRQPIETPAFHVIENSWSFIGDWVIATDSLSNFGGNQPAQYKRVIAIASVDEKTSFNPDDPHDQMIELAKILKRICEKKIEEKKMSDAEDALLMAEIEANKSVFEKCLDRIRFVKKVNNIKRLQK